MTRLATLDIIDIINVYAHEKKLQLCLTIQTIATLITMITDVNYNYNRDYNECFIITQIITYAIYVKTRDIKLSTTQTIRVVRTHWSWIFRNFSKT